MLPEHNPTAHLVQMLDPTWCTPTSRRRVKSGASRPGARPLQGQPFHQDHLKTDFKGLALVFEFIGGEASGSGQFPLLLDAGPDIRSRAAMGDKGL